MSRHASLEDLAGFIEGALRKRKSGRIASHLAGCAVCTGSVQDLQQVPVMLANVAYPPIPTELSGRIEMAIATESVTRVTVTSDGGQQAAGQPAADGTGSGEASRRDLPERRRRQPRRGWRMPGFSSPLAGSLAAVGAAVVIAGGGYLIASHAGGTTGGQSSSSAHVPSTASGGGRATFGPANGPELHLGQLGHSQSVPSIVTSTNFDAAGLQSQAEAALHTARAARIQAAPGDVTSPYAAATRAAATSPAELSKCVSNVAGSRNVLLVDIAFYQQKPATIIVVGTPPGGPGTIYAVGAKCSATNTDILALRSLPAPSH